VRPTANPPLEYISGQPLLFRCPGVRCLEEYIWRDELSAAKQICLSMR